MNTEAKVGAFVLAGIVLLTWAVFLLGDFTLQKRYNLYAHFHDVSGLPEKGIVKLQGVEVGKVKDVKFDGDEVNLTLAINDGINIYRNAKFRIGSSSIIGSKFLEVEQGTPDAGVLEPDAKVLGETPVDLVKSATKALDSVKLLIDGMNGKGNLGDNLNVVTRNLRETTQTMNELLADTKPRVTEALNRMDGITDKLDQLLGKSNEVMAKVNGSTGTVGTLLSDKRMADDVKATVHDLRDAAGSAKDLLGGISRFRVFWNYDSRYEPVAKASRGDVGLKIQPQDWRYYYAGVSNVSNPSDIPKGPDFERKNTIDARLGWQKEDRWDAYVGLIRGAGGVGIKFKPLPETPVMNRVWLLAEASDFLRNRVVNGRTFDSPEYDAGVMVQLHRIVSLGVRWQDIAQTTRFEAAANIAFEDKDIAYLLGLMTFGAAGVGKGGGK